MIVPITAEGSVLLVKQYRHNLKRDTLELPAGLCTLGEPIEEAARRELIEETGYAPADASALRPLGPYYALPSETNKYVHFFLADPVVSVRSPLADEEIEKYFDMSVVQLTITDALEAIGSTIHGLETVAGLPLAHQLLTTGT